MKNVVCFVIEKIKTCVVDVSPKSVFKLKYLQESWWFLSITENHKFEKFT